MFSKARFDRNLCDLVFICQTVEDMWLGDGQASGSFIGLQIEYACAACARVNMKVVTY